MLNKQTAVDIFHNRVNELFEEKKTITTFVIDGIWLECKEMEKQTMIQFAEDYWTESDSVEYTNAEIFYEQTYGEDDSIKINKFKKVK
jgi:hypothetical protein